MLKVLPLIVALGLNLVGTSISAANDSGVLKDLGMLGEWAVDCRLPAGPTNARITMSPTQAGMVTTLTRTGTREATGTIRNVQAISDNRIR